MDAAASAIRGKFPDSRKFAGEEARFDPTCVIKNKIYNPLGLFSAVRSDEVNVLSANGLGGGSLINANVAYRPNPETFATGRWPVAPQDGRELAPITIARCMSSIRVGSRFRDAEVGNDV